MLLRNFMVGALFVATFQQLNGDTITYFDGKTEKTMSVIQSSFAPAHPDACSEKKKVIEPAPAVAVKEVLAPLIAAEIEKDSDSDGIFDSKDECPDTPKGYKVDPKGCPRSVTLHLNFASSSSVLPVSAETDVNALTDFMKENPAASITIIGHTDSTGKAAKNQLLSENRAQALGTRLVQNGIAANRIKTSGKGLSQPIASNKTPSGRAQNRRIEIQIR
ncbi:MAG: hypothetical protein CJD30_10690 [Sulfuricurvum sp. PD_MW2]|jgi:OOP family OmpA-OmpF porin|uniref:OmpA family protein n=1 Tax=Sulfuricurvum sp. PD_MW2 TaxID=2027917 RepID=UPI000C0601F5|nr:OmpA family protein [Sulfuricurvum sp. PD_MW2]PHM16617.1 MAG: hypothetical protein CJD30_10690 [Sulfuricurvum sp. PD_MW2]